MNSKTAGSAQDGPSESVKTATGFFSIGICGGTNETNMGTLWRSAFIYGATQVFTVGARYKPQSTDTAKTWRHIPLVHYRDIDDLVAHLPRSCPLVGIELDERSECISQHRHFDRSCYLLGAEDRGLTNRQRERCHALVQLPGEHSLNVAAAGTVVMHDRWSKQQSLDS